MIVDDHPLFRSGLKSALDLEDDIKIIGISEDGEHALEQIGDLRPDVVLLDVNLPGMNGLQVARQIDNDYDGIAVVILTAHHDSEQVIHALRSGASAYRPKDVDAQELVQTIRDVSAGYYLADDKRLSLEERNVWLAEQIDESTGPYMIDTEGHYIPLSPREMQILEHVTLGMINKEIANKLGISQQTVKNHMTSILKKLNVKDRTQAAVTALRRGWVRIDGDSQQEA
ncbi:MAG: response regulator transcription factor [Phototrophicaceae bacterium]